MLAVSRALQAGAGVRERVGRQEVAWQVGRAWRAFYA